MPCHNKIYTHRSPDSFSQHLSLSAYLLYWFTIFMLPSVWFSDNPSKQSDWIEVYLNAWVNISPWFFPRVPIFGLGMPSTLRQAFDNPVSAFTSYLCRTLRSVWGESFESFQVFFGHLQNPAHVNWLLNFQKICCFSKPLMDSSFPRYLF